MGSISLSRPDRYSVNQRVLFTCGPSRNRPGLVSSIRPAAKTTPELYLVNYRFYIPVQRTLLGARAEPKEIFCKADQLFLVVDDNLSKDEFLKLTPPEVLVRYFS